VEFINHKREAAALLVGRKGGVVFMQQQLQKAIFGFSPLTSPWSCDNNKQLLSARSFVRLLLISRLSVCLSHVAANRHAAEDRRKFLTPSNQQQNTLYLQLSKYLLHNTSIVSNQVYRNQQQT
jgi:hypothetical protein